MDELVPCPPLRLPAVCSIIHGDSSVLLNEMSDGSFDHIITDPPYGEKTHKGARGGGVCSKKLIHFDCMDAESIVSFARQSVRIAKRWVVFTCEWQLAAAVQLAIPESFIRLGVWVKPDSGPQITGDRPGVGWESVVILHRPGKKKWNGGGRHGVWSCLLDVGVKANRPHHPCQKPLELVRRWVREFTDIGDKILDPFAGGGTTGEACLAERRRVTLIEKDPEWVNFCRRRLNKPFPKMT